MRRSFRVLIATCYVAAALITTANQIQTDVTIQGGRWQVASDARTSLINVFGALEPTAYIGHDHCLNSPNKKLCDYPRNLGTASSSQTNTPETGWALPPGCAHATVIARSFDKNFPANSVSKTSSYICWSQTHFGPYVPTTPPPDSGGGPESPILLDVDGRGYRLTSVSNGVQFDIRNDGRPVLTSWTQSGSTNAFLAIDRNGNGAIDNGSELFGNHTPLRSGVIAGNGFEVLVDLDENSDYLIDATDSVWASLLLWTDTNHDGVSSPDELVPIASSSFSALETDYTATGRKDRWGNEFRYLGHVRLGSAGRRSFFDVYLQIDAEP